MFIVILLDRRHTSRMKRLIKWSKNSRAGRTNQGPSVGGESTAKKRMSTQSMIVTSISIKRLSEPSGSTLWRSRTTSREVLLCPTNVLVDYLPFYMVCCFISISVFATSPYFEKDVKIVVLH